ncbi:MAG: S-layer homology domain-containing protein [Bacillota bacterium]|nr:S-layer homology domain-containing protein [Bacillota bacterium]
MNHAMKKIWKTVRGEREDRGARGFAGRLLPVKNLLYVLFVLLFSVSSFAEIPWFEPGVVGEQLVGGEYEYSEITFVTGEPVRLKGTVKKDKPQSPLTAKNASYKQGYTFNLVSEDGGIVINRQIVFDVKLTRNEELGQIKVERKLAKFSESITTPLGNFVLGKYTYNDSRIIDVRTAIAYTSGNAVLERTFYLDGNHLKNSGVLTVKSEIRPFIGYENKYSGNESAKIIHKYDFKPAKSEKSAEKPSETKDGGFGGSVETNLSSFEKTVFDYQYTDPQNISFRGSFFLYRVQENVLEAKYDFLKEGKRKGARERLNSRTTLSSEALTIPSLKDMGGHSAEHQVKLLMAMGILDPGRSYFVPYATISRHDFAKAVYIAVKGELPPPSKSEIIKRQRGKVELPFLDVDYNHEDFHYIEAYKKVGLVYGRNKYLKPNEPITKAEALIILLRSTGLDNVAPAPPYKTTFADDAQIPEWCKDAFYMALEVGLIGGEDTNSIVIRTPNGVYAAPTSLLTKEEAAVLIERLIHHLNETLVPDYREKILKK